MSNLRDVLVSIFTFSFPGYARLSGVEFYNAGQEGYTDGYDPRYSLAFLDTGISSALRPSYVKQCSFNHNYSPAIGVFGAENILIEDNTIYHTVGQGMLYIIK